MYKEPKKIAKKKKIEVGILIFCLLWGVLFLINYIRYNNSKSLFLSVKLTSTYTDGTVTEYYSLGYIYRIYNRNAIKREELVPFWSIRENIQGEEDLPQTHSGYNIPNNLYAEDKYKGLLYYYQDHFLVGTYKCINSKTNCEKAVGGKDEFDTLNNDYLTKRDPRTLEFIYGRYAFIDDSKEQEKEYGEIGYFRTIYLVDIEENKIIARFSDVKESGFDSITERATGDNYKYIVKDYKTNLWGIIKIQEDGTIEEVLPYQYKSITYDEDTGYYIMAEDDKWFVYDLKTEKTLIEKQENIIYDVWYNTNRTLYYKVAIEKEEQDTIKRIFKIYRYDGADFLTREDVFLIMEEDSYVMYLSYDNKIHFIEYTKEEKKTLPLNFTSLEKDSYHYPAFEIKTKGDNYLLLLIYNGPELKEKCEEYYVNTALWN